MLSGKYMYARGVVYGKTKTTQAKVRFDKRTKGNLVANIKPAFLERIAVNQEASGGTRRAPPPPDVKQEASGGTRRAPPPPDEKEVRLIWNSTELQGLGLMLARMRIDPKNRRALEVCLGRAYEKSCRVLDQEELESSWDIYPPENNDPDGDSD